MLKKSRFIDILAACVVFIGISSADAAPCAIKAPPSICFSPKGGCEALVVKAIRSASHSIRVAAYSFTSRPIAQALMDAYDNGVDVQAVIDAGQETAKSSQAPIVKKYGIPLRYDHVHAIMHDKYLVIDDEAVETGSFNFTNAAENNNAENARVDWCAPALARLYAKDWDKHWGHSK